MADPDTFDTACWVHWLLWASEDSLRKERKGLEKWNAKYPHLPVCKEVFHRMTDVPEASFHYSCFVHGYVTAMKHFKAEGKVASREMLVEKLRGIGFDLAGLLNAEESEDSPEDSPDGYPNSM